MNDELQVMAPVADDDPLMIAWNEWKQTKDYSNTRFWANNPDHVEGSLWAAFTRGFQAGSESHSPGGD